MKYGSLKTNIIIIISTILLLGAILGVKFFLINNNSKNLEIQKLKTLTEKEKMNILNQVSTTTPVEATLSDSQRDFVLNQVSTTTPVKEMSYQEKMKILNATQ